MGVPNIGSSNNPKCDNWSLGKDVKNNPPLLEDMGLRPLQSMETEVPLNYFSEVVSASQKGFSYIQENNKSEDFFVFKRRKLDSVTGEDKFSKFTDEVLLMIFQWLPKFMLVRCAQVSKRWKRIAFDEYLWRRLDLGAKTLKPGVVGRVMLRGAHSLRLAKTEISSPIFCPQLQYLTPYSHIRSKLQNLDLSMAAIHPEALAEILSVCSQLRRISLEHCTVSAKCMEHLANSRDLETLNVAMCYGINEEGLKAIFRRCTNLQSLNMSWLGLSSEELTQICRSLPKSLLRLNISGCRDTLTDRHIWDIAQRVPLLLELDVSDAFQLTEASVKTIINYLQDAEYLAFARCFTITPNSYLELRRMANLMYLDVYGILNDEALMTVREHLPNIKVNKYLFSSVARPTVGNRRTSIWGIRVRD